MKDTKPNARLKAMLFEQLKRKRRYVLEGYSELIAHELSIRETREVFHNR